MGAVATKNCPYCKTQSVAFTAVCSWQLVNNLSRALFLCGSCLEGVIYEYVGNARLENLAGSIDRHGVALYRQWPVEDTGDAPADTPPNVKAFFEEGTASLANVHFNAAGVMFRKSIDSATKIINPELSKLSLFQRIDKLIESRALTPDMGAWAHEIRLSGNEAAHEDEPFSQMEAEDLRSFTENFFRYCFTLPAAVRRRRDPL